MKSQYILISTLVIISILFYYFTYFFRTEKEFRDTILDYVKNFENEIIYISKNFNKSYILGFILTFKEYLKLNNIEMNFVCIVSRQNYDFSINKCTNINENCCYVLENPTYIKIELKYCNISLLFKEQNLICICYNLSKENQFYANFICV